MKTLIWGTKASNIETNQNIAYGTATKHLHLLLLLIILVIWYYILFYVMTKLFSSKCLLH